MRKSAPPRRARVKRTVRGGGAGVTSQHRLLTGDWTADVERVETAIAGFTADPSLDHECHVDLFEQPGDRELHVNVTHQNLTRAAAGGIGSGEIPDGYVHNRRFGDTPPTQIVRQIREMVFAGRPGSKARAGIID